MLLKNSGFSMLKEKMVPFIVKLLKHDKKQLRSRF